MFDGIKKFGFGLMRLPRLADGTIDVELVKNLVDEFFLPQKNFSCREPQIVCEKNLFAADFVTPHKINTASENSASCRQFLRCSQIRLHLL